MAAQRALPKARRAYGKQWLEQSSRELRTNKLTTKRSLQSKSTVLSKVCEKGHPCSGHKAALIIDINHRLGIQPNLCIHSLPQQPKPLQQHWEVAELPVQPTAVRGSSSLLGTFKDKVSVTPRSWERCASQDVQTAPTTHMKGEHPVPPASFPE